MYGAIIGDIAGSPYEFKYCPVDSDFPIFDRFSRFTDDTVMTVAVADALMRCAPEDGIEEMTAAVKNSLVLWGREYPRAGYGGSFRKWLAAPASLREPYGSWGNGSAMRVSAAGWLYDDLERTREAARATALPTHNHPEGIKGAECIAAVIFMARMGAGKWEIKRDVEQIFGYDLSLGLDELLYINRGHVSCMDTVPKAITAFLCAESFEEAVRNAVLLGGDTDTQAAVAGSIAEAFYMVPDHLIAQCRKNLPPDILAVIDRFEKVKIQPRMR